MPSVKKNPHPTHGTGSLPPVTPVQVDRVRRSVLDVVRKQIPSVREVLDGNKQWNNQQVRLFGMMLNKVMPDLHHSFNEHTVENKSVEELSYEELMQIARQTDEAEEAEVIDGEHYESGSGEEVTTDSGGEGQL